MHPRPRAFSGPTELPHRAFQLQCLEKRGPGWCGIHSPGTHPDSPLPVPHAPARCFLLGGPRPMWTDRQGSSQERFRLCCSAQGSRRRGGQGHGAGLGQTLQKVAWKGPFILAHLP